jgi:signal transduction histidine kinase
MERLVLEEDAIAYIQLADRKGAIVNTTSEAPKRKAVAWLRDLLPESPDAAAPELVRRLGSRGKRPEPEFAIDVQLSKASRGYVLVGMSEQALHEQLERYQDPVRWSALQIAVLCMAILAVFSAYIVYLHQRARVLNAQLQEESRMAYIGTLAASIAHEVRNPLSSMKMNVQMIENRLEKLVDPELAPYFRGKVERIKGEVDRLEDSISHFLAFARPAPLRAEAAQLNDVVDNVLELLEPQCQSRSIRLVRRYARDLPPVELDPRQLAQAVQNLVINSIQAINRNGTITVTTQVADGAVAVAVADDGPGIPEDIQDKIFEVFFTTREGGTGLGLNIVSRIVEEHGGKLTLQSKPGEGAVFRIALPVSHARAKSQEKA